MRSSVNASVMCPQLRLTSARAAFARPGPHATAFPDVFAPTQPSDSLVPLGRRSGRPSPTAYLGAKGLFFTAAPVPPPPDATPESFLPRLPVRRPSPEESRGSPRCLGHPLRACRAPRPRRVRYALALLAVRSLLPSDPPMSSAPGMHSISGLYYTRPTRSRTYAPPKSVTVPGARLATGRAGSPLAGRVSHPLDDKQGFMVSSHTPILLDQPCLVAPKAGIH